MSRLPLQFLLVTIAGWMTRDHQKVVAYLLAENEVLREHVRGKRMGLHADPRRPEQSRLRARAQHHQAHSVRRRH